MDRRALTGPDFIIIGAMKSATSSLHEQLALQPGIFMSKPKEPNFFSDEERFRQGPKWYLDLFADAAQSDICGESSTEYTKRPSYPETVLRMKAALPDVKLVYVMRHPIDRLVSHYMHEWSENTIHCGIDEALDLHPELIDYSRYGYQLAPYFEAYGPDAVLPVFFAALKRRPQHELERIGKFIGHSGELAWQEDLQPQNVSSQRLRRFPGYRLLVDSAPMERLRRAVVPQSIRDKIKARLTLQERPALTKRSLARLESVFDDDLRALSSWLGFELNCENFDEVTSSRHLDQAS